MITETSEAAYLIDANNYIFRAYHAIPPMTTAAGQPTNATYGFLRTLLKLLRERAPEWAVAIFEGAVTFRNQLYPQYKQNRVEPPDALRPQFADCRRILAAIGIPCLEVDGYEADDVMGTLAERIRATGHRVVLVSGDKDMAQLVGDGITLLDIARDEEFDTEKVAERFGVRPEQIPDLLALHGDSIDNIPGIPGIGTKTARILLRSFRSLDDIAAAPDRIEGLAIRNAAAVKHRVMAGLETARLARRLATIARDAPCELDLERLRYRGADRQQVEGLFDALEFGPRVRGEIPRWAEAAATQTAAPEQA
jgi:5'-3' exonuclease